MSESYVSIIIIALFCALIYLKDYLSAKERDELTKKLIARDLTEYNQQALQTEVLRQKRKAKPKVDPAANYIPLNELDNNPEALENIHRFVESATRK